MVSTTIGDTGNGSRNSASLAIQLVKPRERKRSQQEVEKAMRAALKPIPGIDVTLGNQPIYVALLGPDPAVLESRGAEAAATRSRRCPASPTSPPRSCPGCPPMRCASSRDAVRELGLTTTQLAASLRAFVNGDVATYWTSPDGEQVDVEIRLPQTSRENVAQLDSLPVAYAKDGTPIELSRVADIVPVVNPLVIKRQDLQRRQAIYAGTQGRPSGDVGADVQKIVKETQLPPGYRFDVGGQTKDQQEAFQGVLLALGAAVIFIYIVLASQFGSFLQPLAIMASLPLALIGVMLALLVTRSTLNLFSMIGLVMLMGLVTKNAILLVDFANHGRRAGLSVPEALLQAGLVRMRPIIMTTAAMVFGMLPLALALDEGGEIQAPMGRAIIGGVITSTLLTLVVVPVLYSYLVRDRKRAPAAGGRAERRRRRRRADAGVEGVIARRARATRRRSGPPTGLSPRRPPAAGTSTTGCGRPRRCRRGRPATSTWRGAATPQRIRRLLARVGVRPVGGEQRLGGVRRALQRVVVARPGAALDLRDLGADRDHRVAEAIELGERLALGRLDHQRAGNREAQRRRVEAVVDQALGDVLGADAVRRAAGRFLQRPQVEDAFVGDAAALDAGDVAAVVQLVVIGEARGDVVRAEDRGLGRRAQAVGAHHAHVHPADRQHRGVAERRRRDGADAAPRRRRRAAWPGRNGTRSATTQTGPTPGPPPPCGMQKVLCRLRWLTSPPNSPGAATPTSAFMLAPST